MDEGKNRTYHYYLFSHATMCNEKKEYYCRGMNTVTDSGYFLCPDCPLFGGFAMDLSGEAFPECWYYDLETDTGASVNVYEQKRITDGLILANITKEFPEYLPDDERGKAYSQIEKAICFAAEAHRGVYRKNSTTPYIAHPIEVMMLTARMTDNNEAIAAAALHDVIEDTPYTFEDLKERFGETTAKLVLDESENKREGESREKTWRIRKEENLKREEKASLDAKKIMLADKLSNLRATARKVQSQGKKQVWKNFNNQNTKDQEWYYRSVAAVLKELQDYPQYQEYQSLLEEVFS